MISEVLFNPAGAQDGFEFVELFNDDPFAVDLANYSLGWGGASYTIGTLDLDPAGILASGAYLVIGLAPDPYGFDFNPNLENGFIVADAVGLFDVPAASIGTATPVDALIYGTLFSVNWNGLLDETGDPTVDAIIAAAGQSAARDALGNWTVSATPSPGTGALTTPEPSTALLVGLGLAFLGARRRALASRA
jgi:hypothetical protein